VDDGHIIGTSCGPREDYHKVCVAFYFAEKKGQVIANAEEGGWNIIGFAPREMTWRSKFMAGGRGAFTDHSGDPYLYVEICPFCGGELKPVAVIPRKLLGSGDPEC
jgi:hypothetical protein